jgi:hypothetical protein
VVVGRDVEWGGEGRGRGGGGHVPIDCTDRCTLQKFLHGCPHVLLPFFRMLNFEIRGNVVFVDLLYKHPSIYLF